MENEKDEDPFDVFGGDSDSDHDDDCDGDNDEGQVTVSKESISVAKSLVEAANEKIALPLDRAGEATTTATVTATATAATANTIGNDDQQQDRQLEDLSYLKAWENTWPDPLYKGEILLVSPIPVGGGRGYVATKPIPPGTLVLVESPMMTWPEEQLGKKLGIVSVKHLIEHPNASQLVHDLEDFYPTKEQVDKHHNRNENDTLEDEQHEQISKMIQILKLEHSSSSEEGEIEEQQKQQKNQEVIDLIDLFRELGICSRDGSGLIDIDIIRLLLVLRYNGLESGVYRHVAMLNHDDYPNCAKFLPTDGRSFSEVRTTRPVQAGETLTISYLPRVVSHASRRKVLWEQHRFDIGVNHLKGERYKMELIGNSLPPSPIHLGSVEQSLTDHIENATEDLERMQTEIEASLQLSPVVLPESYETAKALEQAVLELYLESVEQLQNLNHILLIPILSLHMEICANVLKDHSLTNSNQLGVLSRQTVSAYNLLPLQKSLLGADHFDLARTSLDLADAISQLLSRSGKNLYDLKLPSMNTFAAWSAFEQKTRKEHNRIKALYPHDVENHITT